MLHCAERGSIHRDLSYDCQVGDYYCLHMVLLISVKKLESG